MRTFLLTIILFISLSLQAQDNLSALMPYPNHIEVGKDFFVVSDNMGISCSSTNLEYQSERLKQAFKKYFNSNVASDESKNAKIKLQINKNIVGEEAYKLTITSDQINIEGKTPAGILYGVITLEQIISGDAYHSKQGKIQTIFIDDEPAFGTRALMLDPARHFLPVDDVKSYIDQMAKYKYNTLQLHLTDDQGWRIEIKSHPQLTQIGGFRKPNDKNNTSDNGFYTQNQLKDIVTYAQERNIEIIPEIDIPGHTAAILVAYPDLRCDFMKDSVFVFGKTENVMLSAANPKVYEVLDDIIREISEIFPSKTIHLGGDESAIESNWAKSPENIQLMEKNGYSEPRQLMNIFFGHIFE